MKKYIVLALIWMFVILSVYRPSYLEAPVYAWWGSMYPGYCFSEGNGEDGKDKEDKDMPVKIGFRWLPVR